MLQLLTAWPSSSTVQRRIARCRSRHGCRSGRVGRAAGRPAGSCGSTSVSTGRPLTWMRRRGACRTLQEGGSCIVAAVGSCHGRAGSPPRRADSRRGARQTNQPPKQKKPRTHIGKAHPFHQQSPLKQCWIGPPHQAGEQPHGRDPSSDRERQGRQPRTSTRAPCWCSSCASNLQLTGTHVGCDTAQCGACTVHMNGRAVKSCSMLALQAQGGEITTIEGLAPRTASCIRCRRRSASATACSAASARRAW